MPESPAVHPVQYALWAALVVLALHTSALLVRADLVRVPAARIDAVGVGSYEVALLTGRDRPDRPAVEHAADALLTDRPAKIAGRDAVSRMVAEHRDLDPRSEPDWSGLDADTVALAVALHGNAVVAAVDPAFAEATGVQP